MVCPLRPKAKLTKNAIKTGRHPHPTEGKTRTDREKLSISKSLTSHWKNMTEEEREERVSQAKERWLNMDENKKKRCAPLRQKQSEKQEKKDLN